MHAIICLFLCIKDLVYAIVLGKGKVKSYERSHS